MDATGQTIRTRPRDTARGGSSTFTELAQQIRERGLLRRRYGYYWTKLIAAPLAVAVSLAAFVWIGDTWWQLFTAAVLAIVFLSIRMIGFVTLVFIVLSPGIAFVFLAVQLGLFGFYMGISFAPNHKGMPVVPKDLTLDFLRRQVLMSRNVRGSRVIDVVMGGLNYQVEHHLFPSMPRPHLRRAAPLVAAYCEAHDVKYTQVGLFASYAIVVRYINRVGLGERDVFSCPLAEQRAHLIAAPR